MNRYFQNRSRWDEYRWERELRREDRRISCYFRELPCCLDLPGEESLIFDQMASQPGLVPVGADSTHWRLWDYLAEECEDDWSDAGRRRRKPGEELIESLDKLICDWNQIQARRLRPALLQDGMAVSCSMGKLMVCLGDFTDADERRMAALKRCLGKRALGDINRILGLLEGIASSQRSVSEETKRMAEVLRQLRGRLLDLLLGLPNS